MFDIIRYKLARLLCPELAESEYKLCELLDWVTGGKLSKPTYSIRTMISAANDYLFDICDKCDFRIEHLKRISAENNIKEEADDKQ